MSSIESSDTPYAQPSTVPTQDPLVFLDTAGGHPTSLEEQEVTAGPRWLPFMSAELCAAKRNL